MTIQAWPARKEDRDHFQEFLFLIAWFTRLPITARFGYVIEGGGEREKKILTIFDVLLRFSKHQSICILSSPRQSIKIVQTLSLGHLLMWPRYGIHKNDHGCLYSINRVKLVSWFFCCFLFFFFFGYQLCFPHPSSPISSSPEHPTSSYSIRPIHARAAHSQPMTHRIYW